MSILIENMQENIEVSSHILRLIEDTVFRSLQLEGFDIPSEINIMIVDNERIREINQEHRNIDKPTDVLSFPIVDMTDGIINSQEGDMDMDQGELVLGDIVISMEMAKKQADEYDHSLEREVAFLISHGVYHLLGYDHDTQEREKKMLDRQYTLLNYFNL